MFTKDRLMGFSIGFVFAGVLDVIFKTTFLGIVLILLGMVVAWQAYIKKA